MSEDSDPKPLPDYVVAYLARLGTTPEYLWQHYPHTYEVFRTLMSEEEINALNRLGAALALDPPTGDHHRGADAMEDADAAQDPSVKLNKYLGAVH